MRNQWRLIVLLRSNSRGSQPPVLSRLLSHSHFQVQPLISFTTYSTLHPHTSRVIPAPFCLPYFQNPVFRWFASSELVVEHEKDSEHVSIITAVLSKDIKSNDVIKMELESHNIVISGELVLKVLESLDNAPEVAKRFFNWVSDCESETLNSKAYNMMACILGAHGLLKDFWDMLGIMKKKGYGLLKGTHSRLQEHFEKEGLEHEARKLIELFASRSVDTSIEKICSRVCKVIRQDVCGEDVEKRLRELNVVFSSDLVAMVLENLGTELNKPLLFFRWIDESGLFKHDAQTYNTMARILGKEDCVDSFWKAVDEMRVAGFKIEKVTYLSVLKAFVRRKMMRDAVNLYETMMTSGVCKPSPQDFTFLLKKIVVSKELDMNLFTKVVQVFKANGNAFMKSTLDAVVKSLTSVGRIGYCNEIRNAMEEGGLEPSATLQEKIAFQLGIGGKTDEANEFMFNVETAGCGPNYRTWTSLVEGHCSAGNLDEASKCLRQMIEKEGTSYAGFALELLVNAYCWKDNASNASKLLLDLVKEKELRPWNSTYKVLIRNLLIQKDFKEALNLLPLMKTQGYPPYLDPFIEFIGKSGTPSDAIAFQKAVTVKKFSSPVIFFRIFKAFFNSGRNSDAQDFLAKCPRYIRDNVDVLDLFLRSSKRADGPAAIAA